MNHLLIYQLFPRLFGNSNSTADIASNSNHFCGSLLQNGVGKFAHCTSQVLYSIAQQGYTHVWYTGVIDHATQTDYGSIGQPATNPTVVKGMAGSPYAVRDYYNVDPDLALNPEQRMEEFEALVARTHKAGLKVIIDFVPNHVARNYHSVSAPEGVEDFGASDRVDYHFFYNNNFYYCVNESFSPQFDRGNYVEFPARATGNDCFSAQPSSEDWYETVKLNYGVDYCGGGVQHFNPIPNTWRKMRHILDFWAAKGVDGFRCDMAEMVPVQFWKWVIAKIKKSYPELIFIAEIYQPALYREYINEGGFDYLYDKVGLYDTLRSVAVGEAPASSISYEWQSVDDISNRMLSFMENHDEQRIASEFFAGKPSLMPIQIPAIRGWVASAVAALMSRGAFMIYAGQEVGEAANETEGFSGRDGRTSIFDYWRVDSLVALQSFYSSKSGDISSFDNAQKELFVKYQALLKLASSDVVQNGQLYDIEWLNLRNPQFDPFKQFVFLKHTDNEVLLCLANFDDAPTQVGVKLAYHLFDAIGMQPSKVVLAHEFFSGEEVEFSFTPEETTQIEIDACSFSAFLFSKK